MKLLLLSLILLTLLPSQPNPLATATSIPDALLVTERGRRNKPKRTKPPKPLPTSCPKLCTSYAKAALVCLKIKYAGVALCKLVPCALSPVHRRSGKGKKKKKKKGKKKGKKKFACIPVDASPSPSAFESPSVSPTPSASVSASPSPSGPETTSPSPSTSPSSSASPSHSSSVSPTASVSPSPSHGCYIEIFEKRGGYGHDGDSDRIAGGKPVKKGSAIIMQCLCPEESSVKGLLVEGGLKVDKIKKCLKQEADPAEECLNVGGGRISERVLNVVRKDEGLFEGFCEAVKDAHEKCCEQNGGKIDDDDGPSLGRSRDVGPPVCRRK